MFPENSALRRRMLLASVLVVLLPFGFIYTFVFVLNAIVFPIAVSEGTPPTVAVNPVLATVVVLGGIAFQVWKGPELILSSVGARVVDEESHPDLCARVRRLAQTADIEPPSVAVTQNTAPNAMAVEGPKGPTIVVTSGLLDTLADPEVDAVLAHEIAHIRNRDTMVMTIAWLLPTVTYYIVIAATYFLYGTARALGHGSTRSVRSGGSRGGGSGAAKVVLVLIVAAVATLAVSAMFWAASTLVHRVLSRYREYAADRGAVAITGDPTALATALETLDERMPDVPDGDLRRLDGGSEALYVAPLEGRVFTDAELVSTDVFPDTHPPTSERIARLRELTSALEEP